MSHVSDAVYNIAKGERYAVRSVLCTDFYKLLMGQFIHKYYPDTQVTFSLINRTKSVKLAEIINQGTLQRHLNHVMTLRPTRGEMTWLRGNTFYGKQAMFSPEYMEFLENFTFPDYEISTTDDGQFELTFTGPWASVTMWEIPALSIISELKSRAAMQGMNRFEIQVIYAQAMTRLWNKVQQLSTLRGLKLADFGTRRRHSFLWQDWCVQAMVAGLGDKFIGTSNCLLAMRRNLEAIGTNAHECQMVISALADTDEELLNSPYSFLEKWAEMYDGNLRVILPDTFGTHSFFDNAPDWVADWKGVRIDSGDPIQIGRLVLDWFESKGKDTREKLLLFSDGLDVKEIRELQMYFENRCQIGFGFGTMLTNDFIGLGSDLLNPLSLVCKVTRVNDRPAVKLSDNPLKAMGDPDEVARYKRVFGTKGLTEREIVV